MIEKRQTIHCRNDGSPGEGRIEEENEEEEMNEEMKEDNGEVNGEEQM